MRLWIFCLCLIVNFYANGQWYESQGQALIINDDKPAARTRAIENALKQSLLVAGASVSSVQQVVNGLLTQDELSIRASGSVNSIELIDEIHSDGLMFVTIRADIFPQEKQCFSADFRKSVLLTRSNLLHREQANIGAVYALDTVIMQKLGKKLQKNSRYINTKFALKNRTNFSKLNQSLYNDKIKQLSMSLSNATDSQYIIYSEINDISFLQGKTNDWQFWQQELFERNFAISLYVYDGLNGELVYENQYQGAAPWKFNKRARVDLNSNNFWKSDYAQMLTYTLDQAVDDLDENIMCEPTSGKIVRVSGNQITLNLGRNNGVKVGDEFTLLHSSNFTANNGHSYAGLNISPYKVKITQVSRQSATATTTDSRLLGNIQVNDLAVRY
jgi:hypothetical protein